MSVTLFRYVARLYLLLFFGMLGAALVIFLGGDLGDRWDLFVGKALGDVLTLYFNKLLVLVQQLVPVGMLLAAGVTASVLRKRGEWLAMQALGASRWAVLAPVLACGAVLSVGAAAWSEWVVTEAGPRVDRLMVEKFQRWGDYRFYYFPQTWFRLGGYVFNVRGGAGDDGVMRDVTVLELAPGFGLAARYDAGSFTSLGGDRWLLDGVSGRRFDGGGASVPFATPQMTLQVPGSSARTFEVQVGRPEMMRLGQLARQREVREALGLPVARLTLAMHERFSYAAVGWVAALLAATLALRPGRRGHLTLTLVEGLAVTVGLFSLMLVTKQLAVAERLPVAVAAWLTPLVGLGATALLWARADGRLALRAR